MKKLAIPALVAATLVAGCATPAYVSPVEVTRFTGQSDTWLAQGTIQVVPAPGLDNQGIEYGFYRDALQAQLQKLGYRVVEVNGEQVAQLDIDEYVADPGPRRSPVGVGVGGSTGSYGSGVGVGVGINLNSLGGPPAERIEREVSVSIRAAEGGQNLWEGRARMAATSNSDYASDLAAAPRIVEAMFLDFPGESGETIEVE